MTFEEANLNLAELMDYGKYCEGYNAFNTSVSFKICLSCIHRTECNMNNDFGCITSCNYIVGDSLSLRPISDEQTYLPQKQDL